VDGEGGLACVEEWQFGVDEELETAMYDCVGLGYE
jgi:hypothetical protein